VLNSWSKKFLSYAELVEIFRANPTYNLGIVTGSASGLFVIDIDTRSDGLASAGKLHQQGHDLPAGLMSETGGGGYHLLYALPEDFAVRSSAGSLAPGIDVRGEGGMIVAPGSVHKSGARYTWDKTVTPTTRPEPAPQWLLDRLRSTSAVKPEIALGPGRKFSEGTRHPPFLRFAGMLHRYGVDEEGVFAALSALDKQICDPPMGDDEVRRIAQSSAKWEPQNESEIIDHKNYLALAKEYLQTRYMHRDGRTLHYWQGDFLEWDGVSYSQACPEGIRADIVQTHAKRKIRRKVGKETIEEPFKPDAKHGNEMLRALETEAMLPAKTTWPSWTGGQQEQVLAVSNGLLDLQTRELLTHTPAYLGKHHVNVDHDPTATAPRWQAFLNTLWGDDPESIAVLQQIFGYLVAGGLEQQKMFLIMGPTRSGKGTIGAVLEQLVGTHNTVSPTLTGLSSSFGLEPLVDKRLALISDSRLGKRADQSAIVEKLLPYSAGEPQLVNRKYKSMATVRPTARFLFLTNELPGFFDASGALAARFVLLRMTKSFLGREDPELLGKLLEELPGILNWALAGYDALQALGRFGVPESAQVIHEEMREMTSQVGEFLRQQCAVEPGQQVTRKGLHDAYNRWLVQEQGWHTNVTMARFVSELRAACPILGTYRPMVGGVRVRMWTGVGLKRPEIVKAGPVMPSAV
jgi:putative DNA primase/helicase